MKLTWFSLFCMGCLLSTLSNSIASASPVTSLAAQQSALHAASGIGSNLPVILSDLYTQLEEEALLRLLPPSERLTRKFYQPEIEPLFPAWRPLPESDF